MRTSLIGILQGYEVNYLGAGENADVTKVTQLMEIYTPMLPPALASLFKLGQWSYKSIGTDGRAYGNYVDSKGKQLGRVVDVTRDASTGQYTEKLVKIDPVSELEVFTSEVYNALVRLHLDTLPAGSTSAQRSAAIKTINADYQTKWLPILYPTDWGTGRVGIKVAVSTDPRSGLPLPRAEWDAAGIAADKAKAAAAKTEAQKLIDDAVAAARAEDAAKAAADSAAAADKAAANAAAAAAAKAAADADAAAAQAVKTAAIAEATVLVQEGDTSGATQVLKSASVTKVSGQPAGKDGGGIGIIAGLAAAAWMLLG